MTYPASTTTAKLPTVQNLPCKLRRSNLHSPSGESIESTTYVWQAVCNWVCAVQISALTHNQPTSPQGTSHVDATSGLASGLFATPSACHRQSTPQDKRRGTQAGPVGEAVSMASPRRARRDNGCSQTLTHNSRPTRRLRHASPIRWMSNSWIYGCPKGATMHKRTSFPQQLRNAGYRSKSRGYWWHRGKGISTGALRRMLGVTA